MNDNPSDSVNPPVSAASRPPQGWKIIVKRVEDPAAVREGRRIIMELAAQAMLDRQPSHVARSAPEGT